VAIEPSEEMVIDHARQNLQKAETIAPSDPGEAHELLVEARRLDPRNVKILFTLGELELKMGLLPAAISNLTRGLEMGGPQAEPLSLLARSHIILRQYQEAEKHTRAAIQLDPENSVAAECLIDCLIAKRQFAEAITAITRLSEKKVLSQVGVFRVSRNCAICHFMLGDYQQAWRITGMLRAAGDEDPRTVTVHQQSKNRAKAEMEDRVSDMSWAERFVFKALNNQVLNLVMKTQDARLKDLERYNLEADKELEEHRERTASLERRAGDMERAAKTDPLTALPNLRCLTDDYLPKLSPTKGVAVIALDLDKFGLINTTYGHSGGDAALKKVAQIATKWFRHTTNNFFRVGGEEFVGLLFCGESEAMTLAEKFRVDLEERAAHELITEGQLPLEQSVNSQVPESAKAASSSPWTLKMWDPATRQLNDRLLTASIGLAMYPDDGTTFYEVKSKADSACYAAKLSGRNKLIRWRDGMAGKDTAISVVAQPSEPAAEDKKSSRKRAGRSKKDEDEPITTMSSVLGFKANKTDPPNPVP